MSIPTEEAPLRGKRGQNISGVVGVYYDRDRLYRGTKRWRIDVQIEGKRFRRRCASLEEARSRLTEMGYRG